jgi:hypothetical protein
MINSPNTQHLEWYKANKVPNLSKNYQTKALNHLKSLQRPTKQLKLNNKPNLSTTSNPLQQKNQHLTINHLNIHNHLSKDQHSQKSQFTL